MSELDEIKKRINHRSKPLNDYNFKKLYNGMIRFMICMIVLLTGLILEKNPETLDKIVNSNYLNNAITFITNTIVDFLPEDISVASNSMYQPLENNYYTSSSNQIQAFSKGKVTQVSKNSITILYDNSVEVIYKDVKNIQVKKSNIVKTNQIIALYDEKFYMSFHYLGQNISYQEFLNL